MISKLICISGPDGTGKSTQVTQLLDSLEKRGYHYEYRWMRFHHLFSFPILGLARILSLSEVVTLDNGEKIGYHYFYKSRLVPGLYKATMLIDTLIFTIHMVYIPNKLLNRRLICDRFIYDTLIDLMISTGDHQIYESRTGKFLQALIPDQSNTIILLADEKQLTGRREDLTHDKTLGQKINFYSTISVKFNIPVIDASLSVKEVNKKIWEAIQ